MINSEITPIILQHWPETIGHPSKVVDIKCQCLYLLFQTLNILFSVAQVHRTLSNRVCCAVKFYLCPEKNQKTFF